MPDPSPPPGLQCSRYVALGVQRVALDVWCVGSARSRKQHRSRYLWSRDGSAATSFSGRQARTNNVAAFRVVYPRLSSRNREEGVEWARRGGLPAKEDHPPDHPCTPPRLKIPNSPVQAQRQSKTILTMTLYPPAPIPASHPSSPPVSFPLSPHPMVPGWFNMVQWEYYCQSWALYTWSLDIRRT